MASVQILDAGRPDASGALRADQGSKTVFRYLSTLMAIMAWAYAIAVPAVFELGGRPALQIDALAEWIAIPEQSLAIIASAWLLLGRGLVPAPHRRFWWLVLAFTALSVCATFSWNLLRPAAARESLDAPDVLYLADYCLFIAALAVIFVRAGGTFRGARVWLDGATMAASLLLALWSFFLAPAEPRGAERLISVGSMLAYSLTLATMMSMAALVCMQIPNFRDRYGVLLLVGAGLATVAWEIIWLAGWLVADFEFIGPYYNYGDVLCFACIASAVAVAQYQPFLRPEAANPERRVYSFLPTLAVLLAIALVAGALATTKRPETWLLMVLAAMCAFLLITRQRSVQRELRDINHQLAIRKADARLTELVRQSADLILVVDEHGLVSFASPAAGSMLATPSSEIQGMAAAEVLGARHAAALRGFLDRVSKDHCASDSIELCVECASGKLRTFNVGAVNQQNNTLIRGLVLTVHDMTSQRALEREVLDVAMRERARLSGDIHDGLGQELTGIALLLHAAATAPDPDPGRQRQHLAAIVEHVNRTISAARDLARGLSPLRVVMGSLSGALKRLVQESSPQMPVRLFVDPEFEDRLVDATAADHLYRIAQEAVTNAVRHSGCHRIDVELRVVGQRLEMSIADDGHGIAGRSREDEGLGLRLIEYRARLLGGTTQVSSSESLGTRVEVTLPLARCTAAPAR